MSQLPDMIVGSTNKSAEGLLPGSRSYQCSACRTTVWLARSGQAMAAKGIPVVCLPCAAPNIKGVEDVMFPGIDTLLTDLGIVTEN